MRNDPGFELLLPHILKDQAKSLWIVDENITPLLQAEQWPLQNTHILSNRYDIYQFFQQLGLHCIFNDFDFSQLPVSSYRRIFYRVSKEKAIVNHIIKQAINHLNGQGEFFIAGQKQEGMPGYLKKLKQISSLTLETSRGRQQSNLAIIQHSRELVYSDLNKQFNNQAYYDIRQVDHLAGLKIYSKPGIFCWDRLDPGSAFLAENLGSFLDKLTAKPSSCLDLGCGYGYLALLAHHFGISNIIATDNNASAIQLCNTNFKNNHIEAIARASDCGQEITDSFELILCNPPFHHGFKSDNSLTSKFLSNASRLLSPQGKALFVVNQFIPLERIALKYFKHSEVFAQNKSFKLVALKK